MTRDQRFAFRRMQMASQILADPDSTQREQRSARVSFYRGFRAFAQSYGLDEDLAEATSSLAAWLERALGPA